MIVLKLDENGSTGTNYRTETLKNISNTFGSIVCKSKGRKSVNWNKSCCMETMCLQTDDDRLLIRLQDSLRSYIKKHLVRSIDATDLPQKLDISESNLLGAEHQKRTIPIIGYYDVISRGDDLVIFTDHVHQFFQEYTVLPYMEVYSSRGSGEPISLTTSISSLKNVCTQDIELLTFERIILL